MKKYEEKYCPRCNQLFECKPGNISQCNCFEIILSEPEKNEIAKRYNNCLCNSCLLSLKKQFSLSLKHLPLKK